jgi:hypothetical protein
MTSHKVGEMSKITIFNPKNRPQVVTSSGQILGSHKRADVDAEDSVVKSAIEKKLVVLLSTPEPVVMTDSVEEVAPSPEVASEETPAPTEESEETSEETESTEESAATTIRTNRKKSSTQAKES